MAAQPFRAGEIEQAAGIHAGTYVVIKGECEALMNTDLNGKIQGKLKQNRKKRNLKKALLVLSLAAVIFTSTVLANPASALTEDASGEVVQGLENNSDAQTANEQANAQENEAAPSDDHQEAAAAPAAEQDVMNTGSVSAADSAAVTENGTEGSGADASGAEVGEAAKSADEVSAAEGSGTAEHAASGTSVSETAGTNATLAGAAETVSTEEAAEKKTEQSAQSETDALSFADDRAQMKITRRDGSGFPSDTTMSGSPLGTDDWNKVLSAVSSKVTAQSDDSITYSVAGLHTWTLSLQAGDGSAASYDDIRTEAQFQDGLNDAGYASKTSEREETGKDGTSTTTAKYETSWRVYAIPGDSIADPAEDHLTDLTDADRTSLSVDGNGALQSAAFDGSLPETVLFVQVVKETVTAGTEKKEEIPMPAVTLDKDVATDHGTIAVHVEADEGTFEKGTTMSVKQVSSKDILDKAIEAAGGKGNAEAVDISFLKADGTETEPAKPIRVRMTAKILDQADKAHVVHVDDTGSTDVVAKKSDGKTIDSTSSDAASSDAKNTVSFESDSFSVYAIVYTVDFTFSGYTYSIKGGSSILLSSLAEKLGLRDTKQDKDFDIADVDDVTFSDSSLVTVTKKDGDWELVSKKPFTSTEKLSISMKDGSQYEVEVKDAQGEEKDFGPYITSVTTFTNGHENDSSHPLKDGDEAEFLINFEVPSNKLQKGQKLYYKMDPKCITVDQNTSATVNQGDKNVGTMVVGSDGKITINLDDNFDVNKAFYGSLEFKGTVHNTNSWNDVTVPFNDNSSITIGPRNPDLTVQKTGSLYDAAKGIIHYDVNIATINGTKDPVDFKDALAPSGLKNISYRLDTVKITKNNDTSQVNGVNAQIEDGKLVVKNLPALDKNESYHISYDVSVSSQDLITDGTTDGTALVKNTATAENKEISKTSEITTVVKDKPVVNKTGWVDGNRIHWTITVNNPGKKDLSGTKLKDVLSADKGTFPSEVFPAEFVIHDNNGFQGKGTFDKNGDYIFPSNMTSDQYTIEYETPAPQGNPGEQYQAKNTIHYEDKEGNKYSKDNTALGTYSDGYNISKTRKGEPDRVSDNKEILHWSSTINLPDNTIDLDKLTYTDTMTASDNNGSPISDAHYITYEQLQKMVLTVTDMNWQQTPLIAGTDYQILDGDGKELTGVSSDSQFPQFMIKFLPESLSKLKGKRNIDIAYDTCTEESRQLADQEWIWKNKASILNHTSDSEYRHTKPGSDLVKEASTSDDSTKYSRSSISVEYQNRGVIYYRIILSLNKESTGQQIIVDYLPQGLSFGKLTKVVYRDNNWETETGYDKQGHTFNLNKYASVDTPEPQDDGSTKITFKLNEGYERDSDNYHIAFYYTALIDDAAYWGNIQNSNKSYTNNAVWKNESANVTVDVHHTVSTLDKEGIELTDHEKDDGVKKLAYFLTVNPKGEDLDSGDSFTITDQLKTDQNGVSMMFSPDSLKVYEYDGFKPENHYCGKEMDQNRYGFEFDEKSHTLKVMLPDQTPCVVRYEYSCVLEPGTSEATLTNSASINGKNIKADDSQLKLQKSSAAASVDRRELILYKVDSQNYKIKLDGVTFTLEQYNADKSTKWNYLKDVITDEKGEIHLLREEGTPDGVLYRLKEKELGKWQDTYRMSDEYYYFVFVKDTKDTDQQAWEKVTGHDESGVQQNEVNFIRKSGSIYVPNEKTAITINKVWLNSNHTEDQQHPETATVTLYGQAKKPIGAKVSIVVVSPWDTDTNNASYKSGEFYVEPDTDVSLVADMNYKDSYSVNNGGSISFQTGRQTLFLGRPNSDTIYTIKLNPSALKQVDDIVFTSPKQYQDIEGDDKRISRGPFTLNSSNNYSVTIGNLPTDDGNGNKYYYTVVEDPIANYEASYTDLGDKHAGTITVTNTKKPEEDKTSLTFSKIWSDGSNNLAWPDNTTINVTLYRKLFKDGKEISDTESSVAEYVLTKDSITPKGTNTAPKCTTIHSEGNVYRYQISGLPVKGSETIEGEWHYYVKEAKAADGYQKPKYKSLNTDGSFTEGTELPYASDGQAIINQKDSSYTLPSTGGHGTQPLTGAGALLLLLAGTVLTVRKLLIQRRAGKGGGSK
ncbi:MAG: Cna B-type domain-containing protein [Lachnospiraceae bacterium]|nr:Cna B-type domain-containing protein [Lachnospiraceae bacterium]